MNSPAAGVGQQIVSEWLGSGCRWANYTSEELYAALNYASRMDLNQPLHAIAAALHARGALSERDQRDLGFLR